MTIPSRLSLGTSRATAKRDVLFLITQANGPTVRLSQKAFFEFFECPFAGDGDDGSAARSGAIAGGSGRWAPRRACNSDLSRSLGGCLRACRAPPPALVSVLGGWRASEAGRRERRRSDVTFYSFIFCTCTSPRAVPLFLCSRGGAWGGEHRAGAPDGARGASDAHHKDAFAHS